MNTDEVTVLGESSAGAATSAECPEPQVGARFVGDSDPGFEARSEGGVPLAGGAVQQGESALDGGSGQPNDQAERSRGHRKSTPQLRGSRPVVAACSAQLGREDLPPEQGSRAVVMPGGVWFAYVLLALLLGAILALVVHWLGGAGLRREPEVSVLHAPAAEEGETGQENAASLAPASLRPGGTTLVAALDSQFDDNVDRQFDVQVGEQTAPMFPTTPAVASVTAMRAPDLRRVERDPQMVEIERAAAEALRRDDCPSALGHYRQLLTRASLEEFAYAAWLLEERCGIAGSEGHEPGPESGAQPASFSAPQSHESLVDVSFRGIGGRLPAEVLLRVFSGEVLREVLLVSQPVGIALPSVGARARLELECPPGYSADGAQRRLPSVLPPRLSVTLSCRKARPQFLLSVLCVGGAEVEVTSGERLLGVTRAGVGHFLVDGVPGETVQVVARADGRFVVAEPERQFIIEELGGFGVETFRLEPKPAPRARTRFTKPKAVPYRL